MQKLKRVFHPFDKLEDIKAGMWRNASPEERETLKAKAAILMRSPDEFYAAMSKAAAEWPVACENYLTNTSVNHQAWIGHAGCCMAVDSPEDVTRQAWHTLNQQEQDAANAAADKALDQWRKDYAEKISRR